VDGPLSGIESFQNGRSSRSAITEGHPWSRLSTIGIDIAKNVFQVHATGPDGGTVLCRRLRRDNVAEFFASIPPCLVGIEACGTSHHWAREIAASGHDVRLMPPRYVRPYVKRNKHDAADAKAAHVLLIIASDAGSVLMHSHDGRIDHLHRRIMHCGQCIHDLVPDPSPSPANEAIVTSRIGTKRLRQIAPWGA
jgi:limonene-1,2-epoxide hydrolase